MEAPAELLAALPVLATVLALLLTWLLVRRGAAASPGPVTPAKAPGTSAPPCAPEPAAAPEGPGELEGPGEREAAPAEAEEQAAEAKQVRTRPSWAPPPHLRARLPLPPAQAGPGTGLPASGRLPPRSADPAEQTRHGPPPPKCLRAPSLWESRSGRCWRSTSRSRLPPSQARLTPTPRPAPLRPAGSRIHVHVHGLR